ncbi:MAG: hypothetical protein MI749_17000, partial [Desulfovibrionales bacterium]|nr:hypothetical protein [Desulfovibrionales bacterium]
MTTTKKIAVDNTATLAFGPATKLSEAVVSLVDKSATDIPAAITAGVLALSEVSVWNTASTKDSELAQAFNNKLYLQDNHKLIGYWTFKSGLAINEVAGQYSLSLPNINDDDSLVPVMGIGLEGPQYSLSISANNPAKIILPSPTLKNGDKPYSVGSQTLIFDTWFNCTGAKGGPLLSLMPENSFGWIFSLQENSVYLDGNWHRLTVLFKMERGTEVYIDGLPAIYHSALTQLPIGTPTGVSIASGALINHDTFFNGRIINPKIAISDDNINVNHIQNLVFDGEDTTDIDWVALWQATPQNLLGDQSYVENTIQFAGRSTLKNELIDGLQPSDQTYMMDVETAKGITLANQVLPSNGRF